MHYYDPVPMPPEVANSVPCSIRAVFFWFPTLYVSCVEDETHFITTVKWFNHKVNSYHTAEVQNLDCTLKLQ